MNSSKFRLSGQAPAAPDKARLEPVRIRELKTHPKAYVTIAELAEYWLVGRKQLYKQIDAGTLQAIRLGPRLLRIRTEDALDFESRASMMPPTRRQGRAVLPSAPLAVA